MRRILLRLLTVVLAGAAVSAVAWAASNSLEVTLAHMDQAAAAFTGLTANLRKVAHTKIIDSDDVEEGEIVMKRPKPHDVRMKFVARPDGNAYALEGRKIHLYNPKTQIEQVYDVDQYKSLADQFLLLGFGTSSKELAGPYSISLGGPDIVGGEKTTRLELIPKSKDMLQHLTKVELWIADTTGVPMQQKIYWRTEGDYWLATYTNMKINPNLPDSAAKLNVPKGTKTEYPQK